MKQSEDTFSYDDTSQKLRAEALFSSIGEGAIVADEKGKIRQINQAAQEILDIDEHECVGKWFPEVLKAEDISGKEITSVNRPITRAFIEGKPISQRMLYLTKKGRVAVDVTVSPIIIEGVPVGAIEIFRDITLELEIDKMKSEFISIASHQLRTPLTAIKTYSHILFDQINDSLDGSQKKYQNVIFKSITRMNDIIDTLLNVTRLESGQLNVKKENVDIAEVLKHITTELAPLATRKNIEYSVYGIDEETTEKTDPLLFSEVVSNILSNALKYTPSGGKVVVGLEKNDEEVLVHVKDNGCGIPQELQKNVFTKFFRSPQAVAQDANGNGLGLFLAKQISEAIGGDLSFESTEKKGTKFTLSLAR